MIVENPLQLPKVFIDIETTGLNPNIHEIIEIGCIKTIQEELANKFEIDNEIIGMQKFEFKVEHPDVAEKRALIINGHELNELVFRDINNKEQFEYFANWVSGCVLWGWNIVFDFSFLINYAHKYNIDLNIHYHLYDVASMSYPKFISLNDACKKLYLHRNRKHTAMEDIMLTYQIYQKVRRNEINV